MRVTSIAVVLLGICTVIASDAYGGDMCEEGSSNWNKTSANYQIIQSECITGGDSLFSNLESGSVIRKYRITVPNFEIDKVFCQKDGAREVDFNAATAEQFIAQYDSVEVQVDVWSQSKPNNIGLDGTYWLCESDSLPTPEEIPDHRAGAEAADSTADFVMSNVDTIAPEQPMTLYDLRFVSQSSEADLSLLDFASAPVLVASQTVLPGSTFTYTAPKDAGDDWVYFECRIEYSNDPSFRARFRIGTGPTAVSDTPNPPGFGARRLRQNIPNPFNPATTIHFELFRPEQVEMNIYDVAGRLVFTLLRERLDAGPHHVVWRGKTANGLQAPAGIYQYTLQGQDWSESRRMVLLK